MFANSTVRLTLGLRPKAWRRNRPPGDVFGWAAPIATAQTRIATVLCPASSEVIVLNGKQLIAPMEDDHSPGYAIMKQGSALHTSERTSFAAG